MTVSVVKVRRIRHTSTAACLGHNAKGHEVSFVYGWSRVKGIAEDVAHGDLVLLRVPEAAIISVRNPRMRRIA